MKTHGSGLVKWVAAIAVAIGLGGCGTIFGSYEPAPGDVSEPINAPDYRLGPLDSIQVFVWRSPELSSTVPIRPDGRISLPLIEDLQAAGKTPTELARDIEKQLEVYIQDPIVTVVVNQFQGTFDQQVRVVGETTEPQALPYRTGMTVLDVIIAVGGLTEFADGNGAVLVRTVGGEQHSYSLRLDDLVRYGDITANVRVLPGDVVIIPEAWF